MANINDELNQIKNAVYGKEVRSSIHDGIKKINDESEIARSVSNNAQEQVNNIQSQVNQLVVEGDSSVEAAQARVDSEGNTYSTLKERLDEKETEFSSQLAQTSQTAISAFSDVETIKNNPLLRNIHVSNDIPDDSQGNDGDIWLTVLPKNAYYYLGNEIVEWVEGAQSGIGSVSKENDHLLIFADDSPDVDLRTLVSDSRVDLSDINEIYVDWENAGTGVDGLVNTRFNVSTEKMADQTVGDLRFTPDTSAGDGSGIFTRQVTVCDVSSLSGSYYLRFHARTPVVQGGSSKVKVYRVWGE